MAKSITIVEFERVYNKQNSSRPDNPQYLTAEKFELVRSYIYNNTDADIGQIFQFGKDEYGEYFKSRNYVGTIQIGSDITIEILPKIYNDLDEDSKKKTRTIFHKMLRSTVNINYKIANAAKLGTQKDSNIFEVFISMFVAEAERLIQRGLRCGYEEYSGNESFYKGRLDFQQNIRENLVHKERFYVTYDVFTVNRSENRLIRSALEKLRRISLDSDNQRRISRVLGMMEGVSLSANHDADFAKCSADRNMTGYQNVLAWTKVFLKNKSFTSYKGETMAYALLFPMETVFENFIAQQVKMYFTDHEVSAQKKGTYLFDDIFMLRPDIVMEKDEHVKYIIDTKWKLLSSDPQENYGISQADMYQMYAYAQKFRCEKIILCYPWAKNIDRNELPDHFTSGNIKVYIRAVDLSLLAPEKEEEPEDEIEQRFISEIGRLAPQ